MSSKPCQVVVLISGNGSNLQALIDQMDASYQVCGVVSNKADAFGLQRAERAGIQTAVVAHKDFSDRDSFDAALRDAIDAMQPDLVVLAGFMRILGAEFVRHYAGRIVNIHPSLLPKYPGINTHQRALDAGDSEHGVSVHFVTEELDGGPIVARARVAIESGDDADSLADKVHAREHILYPTVVKWFAGGRLTMRDNGAWLDGAALPATGTELDS